jgi:competence protein ComEC
MINVCPGLAQADCHLIEFPDGTRAMIDAGEGADAPRGIALAWLARHGVRHLNLVVISHFHKDHYNRLRDFIEAGIRVDRVAVNVPVERSIILAERPRGYDPLDVQALLQFLRERQIPYFTPREGQRLIGIVLSDGRVVALDVICLYDGEHTPVGETDTNDTSIILRLSDGGTRALFTGDLNWKLGSWLAQSKFDLAADILKAPHHGTERAAPDEFFDRVHPKAVLVPAPKALWLSIRSKRIRTYFSEHHIPAYVSGIDGDVVVSLWDGGFSIETGNARN